MIDITFEDKNKVLKEMKERVKKGKEVKMNECYGFKVIKTND